MCGLAGIHNFKNKNGVDRDVLLNMLRQIKHRGPDEFGIFRDDMTGLGCARLSIIDLTGGRQPAYNEDRTKWIVFTGEIFNYRELKLELEDRGHKFYTNSDTETLLHLYEDLGIGFLDRINGQFAIAIWDRKAEKLILARDRTGIRPLFYTIKDGRILFASEIKSLFADPSIERRLDIKGLDQLITFWTTVGSRTAFEGIYELPPGHYLSIQDGKVKTQRYWDYKFYGVESRDSRGEDEYASLLREDIFRSVKMQLQSEVGMGIYLSGGVDSSIITAAVKNICPSADELKTFSIRFEDASHDETKYQQFVLDNVKFRNYSVRCGRKDIGKVFPSVVWHAEKPLFRTAPAPLYLLSRLARQEGVKSVLSGEGADEMLWGYDTYRENKIRLFWGKFPDSTLRPLLLKKIFPYLAHFGEDHFSIIKRFYQKNLTDFSNPFYSHTPRWGNNEAIKTYLSSNVKAALKDYSPYDEIRALLPGDFGFFHPLERNQYLEILTLLPGYLLSSQGDRMLMANSVEGRYPFLDHILIDNCAKIPPKYKVFGIRDKYILRQAFRAELPEEIYKRSKFAYTAPDAGSFFGSDAPDYMARLLSKENIERTGYFDCAAVAKLAVKLNALGAEKAGYRDNMASVIIVSTLLLHELFIADFKVSKGELPLAADFDYRGEKSNG